MDAGVTLGVASLTVSLATLVIAILIYRVQARDLEGKVESLTRLLTLSLMALENSGLADLERDNKHEIIGLRLSFKAAGGSGSGGTVMFEKGPIYRPPD